MTAIDERPTPYFNGAYVPTGATSMVHLSVWAWPASGSRTAVAVVNWDELTGHETAALSSQPELVVLELGGIRVLDDLPPDARRATVSAIIGWTSRAVSSLNLTDTIDMRFDTAKTADVWGDLPLIQMGTTKEYSPTPQG